MSTLTLSRTALTNTLPMKALAPGTVIFHRHRGYGVITHVNLLTGWISARFGSEARTLDLNLSTDAVQHADGEAILFRRAPPDRMPHARLMAVVRALHDSRRMRACLVSYGGRVAYKFSSKFNFCHHFLSTAIEYCSQLLNCCKL